uniref:Peptidase_M13 domain-containing protein n=1 Tax=Strongyloides papillosus TaxID=174720 RepID=A0A0N5BEM7_STREA
MNFFYLALYTYSLFSLSQGGIFDLVNVFPGDLTKLTYEKLYNATATRSLYEYLDLDVDPYDNFYLFSCGNIFFVFIYLPSEFEEGKYDDDSRIIHTLHKLREKCKTLPEDEIFGCNSEIFNFGTYALSSLFIRKNKIKSEKNGNYNRVKDMVERIKEEFRLLIDEKKNILDEETKNNFLHKLDSMKFVRSVDIYELFAVELMEECYEGMGIDFRANITSIIKSMKDYRVLSEIRKDGLDSCDGLISQSGKHLHFYVYSNAFYDAIGNFFSISSDALNEPSFSRDFPNSLNYGHLGYIVAHEILHAFESDNYKSILEGGNKSKFNVTKIDCFVKQYGTQKESLTSKNINGLLTLGEIFADNGGLKIAHRAYMKYLQNNGGNDLVVPGFESLTNEQLFFISAARSQCVYTSKYYLETVADRSKHIPALIRTNIALSNYKPFSNAFKCELNSKMNPEDKCG